MSPNELRKKYLDFFIKKGHRQIPHSPLIPVDDPTTLFTGSGMQPLIPYLMGQKHTLGKRLVNSQICFRAEDIANVGNSRHTTFFEMLGNWSLGDYFKKSQLVWFYEFLTNEVKLDPQNLYVTVFEGDGVIPRDKESIKIWQEIFQTNKSAQKGATGFDPKIKIYNYGAEKNWWSRSGSPEKMPKGEIGGPDSEVFYDFGGELKLHQKSSFKNQPCHLNCDCGRFLEIGNSVFIKYLKKEQNSFEELPQQNVDFGGGLERILAAKINCPDVFRTDSFWPIIRHIEENCGKKYLGNEAAMRVITDHLKAAVFMINEGLEPDNKLQGYILRRLLRRAGVKMHKLKGRLTSASGLSSIGTEIIKLYQEVYFSDQPGLESKVKAIIDDEMIRFSRTLERGLKVISQAKPGEINPKFAFDLFQTYGFPFEITQELLAKKGVQLDKERFDQEYNKHQKLSRTTAKGLFKGGLADHSEKIVKLHTATHLLHEALRRVLGTHVQQLGSNITKERLRFDFRHSEPLSTEEIKKIEALINEQIKRNLKVSAKTMSLVEAKNQGALAFFGQKYPREVKVYTIGDFSKELCAGPHADFTGKLGKFRIKKEESCGAAKRRIYVVLE